MKKNVLSELWHPMAPKKGKEAWVHEKKEKRKKYFIG